MSDTRSFSYRSMGVVWSVAVRDDEPLEHMQDLRRSIVESSEEFERTYSRFIDTSLVRTLSRRTGRMKVPSDLVNMLRLYEELYEITGGKCTPLVRDTLSDTGYDESYSLRPKDVIRPSPPFHDVVRIIDDAHIELLREAPLDFGALGKGYFIDRIGDTLREAGVRRFLINGSGDMLMDDIRPVRIGLEDPADDSKVIGAVAMTSGAMCSSAGNRRAWRGRHHIIDPETGDSSSDVIATWVIAPSAAVADALATTLFLVSPDRLIDRWHFEYCLMHRDRSVKCSGGFEAELF